MTNPETPVSPSLHGADLATTLRSVFSAQTQAERWPMIRIMSAYKSTDSLGDALCNVYDLGRQDAINNLEKRFASTAPVAWCRSNEFDQFAQGRDYLLAFREQHPDIDMPLYAHPQASPTPDVDQVEGPSHEDVAKLCEEFGFTLDPAGGTVAVLQAMITAAITRWCGPVAEPASLRTQGEVAELVAALEADAECVAAEQPDLMQLTDKQLLRIAELLKSLPHA